jgi:amino-acid N-acetyltransferase
MNASHYIRPAEFGDARAIFQLIKSNPDELVPRAMSDIIQNVDRFFVCDNGEGIVGAASWTILPEIGDASRTCIEIQSVAVAGHMRRQGVGEVLVKAVLAHVRPLHPAQVIVLTFTPAFFARLGFREVPKEGLVHKIYMGCINCTRYESPLTCPEVAMALEEAELPRDYRDPWPDISAPDGPTAE